MYIIVCCLIFKIALISDSMKGFLKVRSISQNLSWMNVSKIVLLYSGMLQWKKHFWELKIKVFLEYFIELTFVFNQLFLLTQLKRSAWEPDQLEHLSVISCCSIFIIRYILSNFYVTLALIKISFLVCFVAIYFWLTVNCLVKMGYFLMHRCVVCDINSLLWVQGTPMYNHT